VIGAEIGGKLFDQPWAGEPGYDEVSWLREREIEQVKWEIQEWRKINKFLEEWNNRTGGYATKCP
jgi:hypothetical protein